MAATVHDLIGRIIDPRPEVPAAPVAARGAQATDSVSVLIGRILAPEWAAPADAVRAVEVAPSPAEPATLSASGV